MPGLIVLPHIGPAWNLEDCLNSMGTVDWPILLVDNSPKGDAGTISRLPAGPGPRLTIAYHPENLGVPASWNLGLMMGCDRTLLVSASVRFPRGIAPILRAAEECENPYGIEFVGPKGWHLLAIRQALVEKVGFFDENFYPAYFEDCDYAYRATLAIGRWPVEKLVTTDAYDIGMGIALKCGFIKPDRPGKPRQLEYFEQKWGGPSSQETFVHPFNDQSKDVKFWPARPKAA